MRCPKWLWSRRRPAALPQCISSNVHRRFKRLFGGCTSGSMRGFGCESRAVRWVAIRSRKTVWTYGMCSSEWRVWLETYHGALVIDLRSLDCYRWMTAMLDLVAHPHSSIPYVHTGFSTVTLEECCSKFKGRSITCLWGTEEDGHMAQTIRNLSARSDECCHYYLEICQVSFLFNHSKSTVHTSFFLYNCQT